MVLRFIRRNLDPADRLGEILFGLVMALGFTGAVSLSREEPDSRELLVAILGCNIAWGIVDGVMYVMLGVFQRARTIRLLRGVRKAKDDAAATRLIADELEDGVGSLLNEEERRTAYGAILGAVRRSEPPPAGLRRADVLGGVAVAVLIVLATLPIVLPFAIVADAWRALRLSNAIALGMLFLLGMEWARHTGVSAWKTGLGVMLIGLVLVVVTILLGG
jgi:VIT1/CCC1 family predicted Fe2+/Mn2+ transporter